MLEFGIVHTWCYLFTHLLDQARINCMTSIWCQAIGAWSGILHVSCFSHIKVAKLDIVLRQAHAHFTLLRYWTGWCSRTPTSFELVWQWSYILRTKNLVSISMISIADSNRSHCRSHVLCSSLLFCFACRHDMITPTAITSKKSIALEFISLQSVVLYPLFKAQHNLVIIIHQPKTINHSILRLIFLITDIQIATCKRKKNKYIHYSLQFQKPC